MKLRGAFLKLAWILIMANTAHSYHFCDDECICVKHNYNNDIKSFECSNITLETFTSYIRILVDNSIFEYGLHDSQIFQLVGGTFDVIKERKYHHIVKLSLSKNHLQVIYGEAFYVFKDLSELDLSHNEITDIVNLRKLGKLQIFNLGFNKLEDVNGSMFNDMGMLKYLYLNNNHLQNISAHTFSDSLQNLECLDLHHNEIASIEGFGKLRLRILNLGFNQLEFINGSVFQPLENLQYLYLNNNKFETVSRDIFSGLTKWSLKGLDLSHNKIACVDDLEIVDSLEMLNISFNELEAINKTVFNKLRNLVELKINNNKLQSLEDSSFQTMVQLKRLHLDNNRLENISQKWFSELITLNYLYLANNEISTIFHGRTRLHLDNNTLNFVSRSTFFNVPNLINLQLMDNKIAKLDSEAFTGLKNLEILNLSRNNLSCIVADTFAQLHKLHILDLTCNRISVLTPESFVGLRSLQHLLLNGNEIKQIPADVFRNLVRLINLELGDNYLSKLSLNAFSGLEELRKLNLSHNIIAAPNEEVLRVLKNLEFLDLSNNNIMYISYSRLLFDLAKLHEIKITGNRWPCEFLIYLLKALREKGINYIQNRTSQNYTEDNVDGVYCIWAGNKFNIVNEFNFNSVPLLQNVYLNGSHLEQTDLNLGFYILEVLFTLIVLSFTISCLLLLLVRYKKCRQRLEKVEELPNISSDVQLLSVSTQQLL